MRIPILLLRMGSFCFLVIALGCAHKPVYQIRYEYLPPGSAEGRQCTQQCETTKNQCQEVVNKELEKERRNLQQAYQQCLLTQSTSRSPIICSDQSQLIRVNYSSCWPDYNHCYQSCGGRVEERNVCVSNCR